MDRIAYERLRHCWACDELEKQTREYAKRGPYGFFNALPSRMTGEHAEAMLQDASLWRALKQSLTPREIAAVTGAEPYTAFDFTAHKAALMERGSSFGWNAAKERMEWKHRNLQRKENEHAQAA